MKPQEEDYDRAFALECRQCLRGAYPMVDGFVDACGFEVSIARLQKAARVLACPVKVNPPCWQHGRILYAAARRRIVTSADRAVRMLDIGTAKGFSALVMRWAMVDAQVGGVVYSVDVIDPEARVSRNTVAEIDGFRTLKEILAPWWSDAGHIQFMQRTGVEFLQHTTVDRFHLAFIDGKHNYENVLEETERLRELQGTGDVIVFDDVHIPGVLAACMEGCGKHYQTTLIKALPNRHYVVAVRRGKE